MLLGPGFLWWGDGVASTDWRMGRTAPNTVALAAGDTLQILQDPVVDNDLVRKKYVDDLSLGFPFFESAESRAASTTTSTTPQNKLSHTTAVLVSGATYEIEVHGSVGNNDSGTNTIATLDATGSLVGSSTKSLHGATSGDDADLSNYSDKLVIVAGSNATAQIDVDYSTEVTLKTARIEDVIVTIRRVA
jgi:hypothetical protein